MNDTNNDGPSREVLSDDAIRKWAANHHPWAVGTGSDRLLRTFQFEDFGDAMKFMAKVAPTADKMDHHPEWENVYNRVSVELTTHDAGGVTQADLELAEAMSAAAHESARPERPEAPPERPAAQVKRVIQPSRRNLLIW
ncbi:MAG: 4a-hydroxytetrahydrobiopterin dehydratase [Microthrixaceae bacterium]